jgi:hypothetical protein
MTEYSSKLRLGELDRLLEWKNSQAKIKQSVVDARDRKLTLIVEDSKQRILRADRLAKMNIRLDTAREGNITRKESVRSQNILVRVSKQICNVTALIPSLAL